VLGLTTIQPTKSPTNVGLAQCYGPVLHSSASPLELLFRKQLREQLHERGRDVNGYPPPVYPRVKTLLECGYRGMLVEIGPEGWTPTQQPPEFSPSLHSALARFLLLLERGEKTIKLNRTERETRKYSADRRSQDQQMPSVLSSHYSVSVSLQGVHYL
jgi:hypothetical protein